MYTGFGKTSQIQEVQKAKYEFSQVLHHQAWLKVTIHTVENSVSNVHVISTVFESKDKPTQMTKQSFTIIDFITYRKSIHFELICKDVHNQ